MHLNPPPLFVCLNLLYVDSKTFCEVSSNADCLGYLSTQVILVVIKAKENPLFRSEPGGVPHHRLLLCKHVLQHSENWNSDHQVQQPH